jgi:shikimate kinase
MRIYLVGFMGSGKSTLGQAVATHYQVPFLDTDSEIEIKVGMSIPDIFIDKGEHYFRDIESEILKSTQTIDKSIIATGGGLPCHHDNMDWILQHGISIYLEWPLATLKKRLIGQETTRPMLANFSKEQMENQIESLFLQRLPFYEKSAITIEMTDDQEKNEAVLIKACKYIW